MGEIRRWWDVDVVREHAELAAAELGRQAAADFIGTMATRLKESDDDEPFSLRLESPLEAIFYVWWAALAEENRWLDRTFYLARQMEFEIDGANYRVDFAVGPSGETEEELAASGLVLRPIIVEVDGHAFHEKTLEQVAYRNQRDRAFQQVGLTIMHFSWSEMTSRPIDCVREVLGLIQERYWALLRQRREAAERAAANQEGALTTQES